MVFNLVFLFAGLWLSTLAVFLLYLKNRKKRHARILDTHLKERDKSYAALLKSEERYQKLIRNMNEGLIFTNEKDKVQFINKCACALLKITPDKIIGRSILEFVLSDTDARKLGLPYELKRPGCSHHEEIQMVRQGGEMFWASLNISYMDELHDHMPGAIIMMSDISSQKKTEEKLHHLTSSLNQKVKQLDCLFDVSDVIHVPGISYEGIFERTLDLIPQGLRYSEDVWAEIEVGDQLFRSANFRESRWSYSVPIRGQHRRLGRVRVGYLENKPLINNDPFHLNEKILIKNIAEKLGQVIELKQLEKLLLLEKKQLDQLNEINQIGNWEWILGGPNISYSSDFLDIMGVPRSHRNEFNPEKFMKMVYPPDRKAMEEFIHRIKEGRNRDLSHAYRIQTASGQLRYIYGNGRLIHNEKGQPEKIIGTAQDITVSYLAFHALEQSTQKENH